MSSAGPVGYHSSRGVVLSPVRPLKIPAVETWCSGAEAAHANRSTSCIPLTVALRDHLYGVRKLTFAAV